MGIFDGLFNPQGGMESSGILGNLPPWMTQGGSVNQLPDWLKQIMAQPGLAQAMGQGGLPPMPQGDAMAPPNAQPASLSPQQAPQMQRSMWTPPDSNSDSPPLGSPFGPPIGAPQQQQMPPQQPGMSAMAQAPQGMPGPQSGGQQTPGGNPMGAIGDFLIGTLMGGPRGGIGAVLGHNQKQETYNQLIASGVEPQKAWFAVNAPKEGALTGALGEKPKPQFHVIGQNQFGQPQYGFVDPTTQKVTPYKPQSEGDGTAADPSLTGEEYLKTLPPGLATQVKAIVEGRQAPPGGFAMKSPMIQQIMQAAGQYEPGFDLTKWTARAAGNKDFYGGGKSSEMVRAANQTIHHVGALVDSMDKLSNTQYPMVNTVGNAFNQHVMGTGAVTEFLPNAHAVAEEMSKVFKGANLSDAEIKQWEASLNQNMSPEQQRASVGKLMVLLNGSLEALENKRNASLGESLSAQKGPLLDDKSRQTLEKVNAWIGGAPANQAAAAPAPAQAAAPTATGPDGKKLILQNGQWVPMK